ncbi:MAG: ABC transporter permease [Phycisphaera sp.]|nr:ABC transporter permease [Phycisphaera sp.]
MQRYLTVMRLFWSTSLAAEMEYRTNFALAAVVSLGNMVGSVFALYLLFSTGYLPGGWKFEQAMLVLGFFTLMNAFANAVLRVNLSRIVQHVQDGTLDFILLKPIDSQFWLSTRNFSAWGLPNVAYGLIVLMWAGRALDLNVSQYAMAILPLVLGLIVLYSAWFTLGATSIWFVEVHNVTHVLHALLEAGRYPLTAYPVIYQFFFTFVVPVAFMTTVPAWVMMGEHAVTWVAGGAAFAFGAFVFSRIFWRFALRYYTSASS